MTAGWFGGRLGVLGAALAISAPLTFHAADAARVRSGHHAGYAAAWAIHGMSSARAHYAYWGHSVARYGSAGGGLQCVPFARENTGIELTGNANTWWDHAAGVYERGAKPEVGSVLNFRGTSRMRMGHVAVVSNVVDSRTIEIDHANWSGPGAGSGRIARNITAVDVSPNNDWSAVRVALGNGSGYGSVYPTYGFIYDRPDRGTMLANTGVTPALATSAAVTGNLQDAAAAPEAEEVAEAGDDTPRRAYRHRSWRHAQARYHGRASMLPVASHGFRKLHRLPRRF